MTNSFVIEGWTSKDRLAEMKLGLIAIGTGLAINPAAIARGFAQADIDVAKAGVMLKSRICLDRLFC